MYFPLGWPKELSCGIPPSGKCTDRCAYMTCEEMTCIVPNRYHMLFALLGSSSISIWHSKPCVEILCYKRPEEQVAKQGSCLQSFGLDAVFQL